MIAVFFVLPTSGSTAVAAMDLDGSDLRVTSSNHVFGMAYRAYRYLSHDKVVHTPSLG